MPSEAQTKPTRKKFDAAFSTSLVLIAALGATAGVLARNLEPQQAVEAPFTSAIGQPVQVETTPAPPQTPALPKRSSVSVGPQVRVQQPRPQVRVIRRFQQPPIAITRGS